MTDTVRLADGLYRPDFTKQATVYGPDSTGRPTVTLRSGLACTLISPNRQAATTGQDRAELAGRRELHWDGDYVLPETGAVEIAIAGVRWRPVVGTYDQAEGPTGEVYYRFADVTRVR